MKSSEIIRKAIDNHLEYRPWVDEEHMAHWLCWCVVLAFPNHQKTGCLRERIIRLPQKYQVICDILERETAFYPTDCDFDEKQQMRYMYADFLAYYFEDMGD